MKIFNSDSLINSLSADLGEIILQSGKLQSVPLSALTHSPGPGSWSIAQVLEHLNVYARHYITEIETKLHFHHTQPQETFRSGWLGNYFSNLMKPAAGNKPVKKMKAPKNALPSVAPDAKAMLDEFIAHQHHLGNLLEISRHANLSAIRVPTSLSSMIRLKLGDTFRFVIAHEQRHMQQIQRLLAQSA